MNEMSYKNRLFNIPDANLIEFGEVVAAKLPDDIVDVHNFDRTVTEAYPASIKAAINEVKAIPTDQVIIDEMAELTKNVNDALAACNKCYRTISFFVRKAFPENKSIQNQFGLNDIANVRYNDSKMILFFNDVAKVVNKYWSDLVEAGCNEAVLQGLEALGNKLQEANTRQELFKKERGVITSQRIDKLNQLYNLLVPISQISQIIFADDQAKLATYALPRPKSSSNGPDDLIVS